MMRKGVPGRMKKRQVRQKVSDGDCVLCIHTDIQLAPVLAKMQEHGARSQDQGDRIQQADRHGSRNGVVQNMQD